MFTIHFIFRVILVKLKLWTQWAFVLFFAKVAMKLLGLVLVQVVPKVARMIMYFGVLNKEAAYSNLNQKVLNADVSSKIMRYGPEPDVRSTLQ